MGSSDVSGIFLHCSDGQKNGAARNFRYKHRTIYASFTIQYKSRKRRKKYVHLYTLLKIIPAAQGCPGIHSSSSRVSRNSFHELRDVQEFIQSESLQFLPSFCLLVFDYDVSLMNFAVNVFDYSGER